MNSIAFYNINYSFPSNLRSYPKSLWVSTQYPVESQCLRPGSFVRIVSSAPEFQPPNNLMRVQNVVGTRIVLIPSIARDAHPVPTFTPYQPQTFGRDSMGWTPLSHGYQWGYDTREADVVPHNRNWLHGNGEPVGYLVW